MPTTSTGEVVTKRPTVSRPRRPRDRQRALAGIMLAACSLATVQAAGASAQDAAASIVTRAVSPTAVPDPGPELQGWGTHQWVTTRLPATQLPTGVGGMDFLVPDAPDGRLPVVTMIAGFSDTRDSVRWLAERLASHGLLVQLIDPVTSIDPPDARARSIVAAQGFLGSAASPVRDRVDLGRTALWGYSMGGGGALEAASRLPGLDAVVAVFPWDVNPHFPAVTASTLVVAGEQDGVALPRWYAEPAYASLTMPDRAFAILAAAHHPLPSHSTDPRLTELSVAWLVDHLEGSAAARAWRCPGPATGVPVAGTAGYSRWQATCSSQT